MDGIFRTSELRDCLPDLDLVVRMGNNESNLHVNGDIMYRRELLKGSTETLLLSLLALEPMYGYQMVREMESRSKGYFRFKEGTLYSALHRLEEDGLIDGKWRTSASGQNRRYYYITAKGEKFLEGLLEEWKSFSQAANMIIETGTS